VAAGRSAHQKLGFRTKGIASQACGKIEVSYQRIALQLAEKLRPKPVLGRARVLVPVKSLEMCLRFSARGVLFAARRIFPQAVYDAVSLRKSAAREVSASETRVSYRGIASQACGKIKVSYQGIALAMP
jgi:hypothetical protein